MSKDAYWFRHDSNAAEDPKMVRLIYSDDGMAKFGFYWCCIGFLRDQSGYKATMDEIESLEFKYSKQGWINDLIDRDLLSITDGMVHSESLDRRMFAWDEKKRKLSAAGRLGGRPRKDKQKTEKKKDDPAVSSDAMKVAEYLLTQIRTHKPDFKTPNMKTWEQQIDRAIRIDKRSPRELCEAVKWIHCTEAGDFWKPNILSGKKLREKLDQIQMNIKRSMKVQSQSDAAERISRDADESWKRILVRIYGKATAKTLALTEVEKKVLANTTDIRTMKQANESRLPYFESAYKKEFYSVAREEKKDES